MPHTKTSYTTAKNKGNWCTNNCKMFAFYLLMGPAMFFAWFPSLGTFWQIGNNWALDLAKLFASPGLDIARVRDSSRWVYFDL